MKEKVLVSACLLGVNCKYNGKNNYKEELVTKLKGREIIPFCPEIVGGLTTPRLAAEVRDGKVVNEKGVDVTDNFVRGANETLRLCQLLGIKKAILKAKSPSCGYGKIYDGTFSSNLVDGNGITAELLIQNGIDVIDDNLFLESGDL